jgi:hypothetical protein
MSVTNVAINGLIVLTARMDLYQKGALNASGRIGMES